MKSKKMVIGAVSSAGFFFFVLILLIVVAASGGSGSEEPLNRYHDHKEIYTQIIQEVYEEKGYRVKANELCWYFVLTNTRPNFAEVKIMANWIAEHDFSYSQLAEKFKEMDDKREALEEYSILELVIFIEDLDDLNEIQEDDNDEIVVGEGSEIGVKIAKKALTRIGYMYLWGGCHTMEEVRNPNQTRFDCSGLVCWAHYQNGIDIGVANTKLLSRMGKKVNKADLSVGDIILFSSNKSYAGIHHVGIYIGNNQMVHAPQDGVPVQIARIDSPFFTNEYYAARRLY